MWRKSNFLSVYNLLSLLLFLVAGNTQAFMLSSGKDMMVHHVQHVKGGIESVDEEENVFDGYAMRDAVLAKFGKCFDMDFRRVDNMGQRDLYLNVLPFHLKSRQFRHASEHDYLCHLQAIVDILIKYNRLDHVLTQMEETTKKPRAGTSPLIAVPFRLDLPEHDLDKILS